MLGYLPDALITEICHSADAKSRPNMKVNKHFEYIVNAQTKTLHLRSPDPDHAYEYCNYEGKEKQNYQHDILVRILQSRVGVNNLTLGTFSIFDKSYIESLIQYLAIHPEKLNKIYKIIIQQIRFPYIPNICYKTYSHVYLKKLNKLWFKTFGHPNLRSVIIRPEWGNNCMGVIDYLTQCVLDKSPNLEQFKLGDCEIRVNLSFRNQTKLTMIGLNYMSHETIESLKACHKLSDLVIDTDYKNFCEIADTFTNNNTTWPLVKIIAYVVEKHYEDDVDALIEKYPNIVIHRVLS